MTQSIIERNLRSRVTEGELLYDPDFKRFLTALDPDLVSMLLGTYENDDKNWSRSDYLERLSESLLIEEIKLLDQLKN